MPTRTASRMPLLALQSRIQGTDGRDDLSPGADCPLRIILVGPGIAEIDEQAIPEILGDVPFESVDDLGAARLVGANDLSEVFGIELTGELR